MYAYVAYLLCTDVIYVYWPRGAFITTTLYVLDGKLCVCQGMRVLQTFRRQYLAYDIPS